MFCGNDLSSGDAGTEEAEATTEDPGSVCLDHGFVAGCGKPQMGDVLEPITLSSGWDLRRAEDSARAMNYVARERPDVIVVAWPCTAFSPVREGGNAVG